nr:hypothetical protein [Deltaproteobacteria bacterium]
MIWLLSHLALAQDSCDYVGLSSAIGDLAAPAVIVLGDRKSTPRDLDRADRLVQALERQGEPVTLAFEA